MVIVEYIFLDLLFHNIHISSTSTNLICYFYSNKIRLLFKMEIFLFMDSEREKKANYK